MGESVHQKRIIRWDKGDSIYLHGVIGHLCHEQIPDRGATELRHRRIPRAGLQAWLRAEKSHSQNPGTNPKQPSSDPSSSSCSCQPHSQGFRLLICERSLNDPPVLYLTSDQMQDVQEQFTLPADTLSFLNHYSGGFRRYHKNALAANKSSLTLKAYQKGEIGNFVLSLTYDHESSWTDALIIWTDQTFFDNRYNETHLSRLLTQLQSDSSEAEGRSCRGIAGRLGAPDGTPKGCAKPWRVVIVRLCPVLLASLLPSRKSKRPALFLAPPQLEIATLAHGMAFTKRTSRNTQH